MKLEMKNSSLLKKFVISYLVILLIPILIFTGMYFATSHIIESITYQSNRYLLEKTGQMIDNALVGMDRIAQNVAGNKRVRQLMDGTNPDSTNDRYELSLIMNELLNIKNTSDYVEELFLYLKDKDLVVTPYSYFGSQYYWSANYNDGTLSYEQWQQALLDEQTKYYKTLTRVKGKEQWRQFMLVQNYPLLRGTKNVAVVICLDKNKIYEDVKDIEEFGDSSFYVMSSEEGMVIGKEAVPEGVNDQTLKEEYGIISGKLNREKVAISYVSSKIIDWKYMVVTSTKQILGPIHQLKYGFIAVVLVCLVIGGVIAIYIAKKNYYPISRIMEKLREQIDWKGEGETDEYVLINQALQKLVDQNTMLSDAFSRQKNVWRQNFLYRLMKGRKDETLPAEMSMEKLDISFQSDTFCIAVFWIKDIGELFRGEDVSAGEREQAMQLIIDNILSELLEGKQVVYTLEVDNILTCLINTADDSEDSLETAVKALSETSDYVEEYFHITVMPALSNIVTGLDMVAGAYRQALDVMEYESVMGSKTPVIYREIEKLSNAFYYFPLEKEQQLMNTVTSGDEEAANRIIEEIIHENFEKEHKLSAAMAKCLISDLISAMMKAIHISHPSEGEELMKNGAYIDRLIQCETVQDMQEVARTLLRELCGYVNEQKPKTKINKLAEEIAAFIQQEYTNQNLNISYIADHFGFTPSYVSKVFRDYSHQSLLDYINEIRVNAAKELMQDKSVMVGDVSTQVGFTNVRTFTRIFKKYVGVTPGKFKE